MISLIKESVCSSLSDKDKLAGVADGAEVNVIETIKVDGTALTPASKAVNIDLSGKKNVQSAVSDPTASGNALSFIDTVSQNVIIITND